MASSDAGRKKIKVAKKNILRAEVAGSSPKEDFFRLVILKILLARLNIDRIGKRDLLLKFRLYRVTTIFRQENLVQFVLIYF